MNVQPYNKNTAMKKKMARFGIFKVAEEEEDSKVHERENSSHKSPKKRKIME